MQGVARILFERRRRDGLLSGPDLSSVEVRALLDWLDQSGTDDDVSPEYRPPIDVIETPAAIEVIADLPGVAREGLRVAFTDGVVIIAGRKRASACQHQAAFHLAERAFGRFASGIRIDVAVDLSRARAVLRDGELHISLPRIAERRRHEIAIPIDTA
jgi:HSP20 family protein